MKNKIWIVPHTHYDAEVFMNREKTFEVGFSNLQGVLGLLRNNSKFKFVLDQVCYIEPFLKSYPEEKEFFQKMISEGRLEITCGMYVMPDVNIPGGESLIRQIIKGKEYCQHELGIDVKCGWMIDTFGHHPQIPQIMKKCGFDYYVFGRAMKAKSPSEFYWEGIDGTRLFCHWMPGGYGIFYHCPENIHEFSRFVARWANFLKSHAVTSHIFALSGSDLSPVEPSLLNMVEEYNRSCDDFELAIATPGEFFEAIKDKGNFSTIKGDLNPIFQGCYSARIEVKQWNRYLENLLLNCEKYQVVSKLMGLKTQEEQIEDAWEGVLFNQFHDIICGSHVDEVFANTMDRYKYSRVIASKCLEKSLVSIAKKVDTSGEGVPVVVFNPLGWERTDYVECKVGFSEYDVYEIEVRNSSCAPVPLDLLEVERYKSGGIQRARVLFIARDVPSFGYEVYRILKATGEVVGTDLVASQVFPDIVEDLHVGSLENKFFRLRFDLWKGVLTSIFAKANRWEVVPEGMEVGNTIVKEQDFGDLWQYNGPCKGRASNPLHGRYPFPKFESNQADFSHNYAGDGYIKNGKAVVEFGINYPFGSGHFTTRVRLYAGVPRIDVQTSLINNDERVRYRAALPTTVKDGTITHEIPFGAIERPEGEFPAQNWIDYSNSKEDKGIALLNKGLPGGNVVGGVVMLSLLKCTVYPFRYAQTEGGYEKGKRHVFDYSIVPHRGDWRQAQIYRRGSEFNNPLIPVKVEKGSGELSDKMSFLEVSGNSVVVSAVKLCGESVVVRVYEAEGKKGEFTFKPAWKIKKAFETNLIEKEKTQIQFDEQENMIHSEIGPFEIKTFKLNLAPELF